MKKLTMALLATTVTLGVHAATPVQAKEIKVATGTFHPNRPGAQRPEDGGDGS